MAVKDRNYTRDIVEMEVVEVVTPVSSDKVTAEKTTSEKELTFGQQFEKTAMLKGIYGFIGLVKEAEKKYAV